MDLAPDLADAHLARYTLSNQRRYEDARQHFEAAARINPNLFDAYYYYGRAAFAAGDIEKSIELWQRPRAVRREDFESPLLQAQSPSSRFQHGGDRAGPVDRGDVRAGDDGACWSRRARSTEYHFLEHGAFWAILALSVIMLASVRYEIPEAVTGPDRRRLHRPRDLVVGPPQQEAAAAHSR